jgi:dTDP-4-amino-4,6-dideoxygalactose transaminase
MPEVAAALGLAQTERMDFFINLRKNIAAEFLSVMDSAEYMKPQEVPHGYESVWWTVACKYVRDDVPWQTFRKKYVELGGDGIYAAWALLYKEALYESGLWKRRCPPVYDGLSNTEPDCPNAELIQPQLMQFVNNYGSVDDAMPKIEALSRTIDFFA